MPFQDRADAGRRLADALKSYGGSDAVVFALPRGGAPVAGFIATALHAPLDIVLARKIGVPFAPELAMGAIADAGNTIIVRNEEVIAAASVSEADFAIVRDGESREIERQRGLYLGGRERLEIHGRVAIVVDDGIATGATTRAALRAVRARGPKKLVLAIPVGPTKTLGAMRDEADEVVCLEAYEVFGAVGCFYADFHQVSDEEVIDIINAAEGHANRR